MNGRSRWRSLVIAVAVLLSVAGPTRADESEAPADAPTEPQAERSRAADISAKAFDVVVLRTAGAAATGLGFGAFVVALPFTAATIGWREPWEVFVLGPAEYTFVRPLGDF